MVIAGPVILPGVGSLFLERRVNSCATHVAFYFSPSPFSCAYVSRWYDECHSATAAAERALRCFRLPTRLSEDSFRPRVSLRGRITCSMLAVLRNGRGRLGRPSPFLRHWDCTRVPPYLTWRFLGNDMVRLQFPGSAELVPGLAARMVVVVVFCLALAREFLLLVAPSVPGLVDSCTIFFSSY